MTANERAFILDKARSVLDHATGAHYCECVTELGPAQGFQTKRDPACEKCNYAGLISNPGWDGTREHFDALLPAVKASMSGGTAIVEPGDGVGPGKSCGSYSTGSKGIRLTRGWRGMDVENGDQHERDVSMTWTAIFTALTDQQMRLM